MTPPRKTGDVFVPGRYPRYTYNPRSDRELEQKLRTYLDDGGAILTLVGPTKTGKTVLLRGGLENPVWIEAQGIADAETFWDLVGTELELLVESAATAEDGETSTGGGEIGIAGVFKAGGEFGRSTTNGTGYRAVRVTGVEARKALQASGRVLVVDDFHFLPAHVQKDIVRAVKPLVFNDVRVIFAAISHRVHDVPRAVEDMVGRTEPLEIDLWAEDELVVIARRGFETLGVEDAGDELARKLAANSFGSPHLMQKLCRELVRDVNGVTESISPPRQLVAPDDWDEFFAKQVEGYAGQWFIRLLNGPKQRGSERTEYLLSDSRRVDGYGLILVALASTGPELSVKRDQLDAAIDEAVGGGPKPEGHQLTRFLNQMSKIAKHNLDEEVLPEDVLDDEDGSTVYTYTGAEPVLEYVDDGSVSVLTIADPFFAYYMRWGSAAHIVSTAARSFDLDGRE